MPPVRFLTSFFPLALVAVIAIFGGRARGGDASTQPTDDPIAAARSNHVVLADVFGDVTQDPFAAEESPGPVNEWGDQRGNNGNAHVSLDFAYANRYVYRGVNQDAVATHGNSLNLLFDGKLQFDLGQYPHPFVELFTNVYDADPASRFQEVRPILGFDWDLKPFDVQLAHISYIYPEREDFNYPEIDLRVTLDDYLVFNTEKPVLSPYILAAYEYQKNEGWYLEFGAKHDFVFEDLGLTVTPRMAVGWISGRKQQFVFINELKNTGWQHLEVGLELTYSLNHLLNVSKRFGEFNVKGYGFYSTKLNDNATAFTGTWGGIGLGFKY